MIFRRTEEEEKNDFFDGPDINVADKNEKAEKLSPDNPDYWEQEESRWNHLKPTKRFKWTWLWLLIALTIALICAVWLRYFNPYIEDATQYGYIDHIEKRGTFFKTYEGILIPYKELMDTTRVYQRDFPFSAANDRIGKRLKELQDAALPVKVTYKRYHATLPWRGAAQIVVTEVDTADVTKILPPEFSPVSPH